MLLVAQIHRKIILSSVVAIINCDLNILRQDPGSTPAPDTTFQKQIVKNEKPRSQQSVVIVVKCNSKDKSQAGYNRGGVVKHDITGRGRI